MLINSICDVPEVLRVMKIVKIIILIIKIVVPIILIVTGMIDLMKEITNNKDNIKDTLSSFVRKAIAAILIFLMPTIIHFLVNLVDSSNNYKKCFEEANSNSIEKYVVYNK